MQPEQWAEDTVLEPAYDEFTKSRSIGIAAIKATNIGGPPGQATQGNIQTGAYLVLQGFECAIDIARPDGSAIMLAARPGRTAQIKDIRLASGTHALVETALM